LLGSMSSPRAANDREMLAVLCLRFDATAGQTLKTFDGVLSTDLKSGKPMDPRMAKNMAVATALDAMKRMFCEDK